MQLRGNQITIITVIHSAASARNPLQFQTPLHLFATVFLSLSLPFVSSDGETAMVGQLREKRIAYRVLRTVKERQKNGKIARLSS